MSQDYRLLILVGDECAVLCVVRSIGWKYIPLLPFVGQSHQSPAHLLCTGSVSILLHPLPFLTGVSISTCSGIIIAQYDYTSTFCMSQYEYFLCMHSVFSS